MDYFHDAFNMTAEERRGFEQEQNIYSIIRTLDALEQEYSRGWVDGKEYEKHCLDLIH